MFSKASLETLRNLSTQKFSEVFLAASKSLEAKTFSRVAKFSVTEIFSKASLEGPVSLAT